MAVNGVAGRKAGQSALSHTARIVADGIAAHPHVEALRLGSGAGHAQALTDLVHLLSKLYGQYPGLVDLALASATGPTRAWLERAARGFEQERMFVVRLTAAVGPIPSTPGAAHTESAVAGQRHALETLARSERRGCALGAAVALLCDWRTVRPLLDRAAERIGTASPVAELPDDNSIDGAVGLLADEVAAQRAVGFGSEQLLLQHRSLFDLLEARAEARQAI
ncbi:hypothetical protein HMF7854_08250 [Sphingomonas ginkgonis]|uniref:Uncharacterized protein n=1 Tax=Sphingomonas ginkgonis TaxID=2315330 RepID=A0A3R9X7W3_9SPHN|nr:hypothetical protein [Sphingomonas ginkgonis]RST30829.1 hypothetical protein HMF7854_08250 [Sphingomonas ginkgonis]